MEANRRYSPMILNVVLYKMVFNYFREYVDEIG